MDKLKMHSPNLTESNIAKIGELFPNCITESADESGNKKPTIDFDLLRQELSESIVEGPKERFHLDWPGKRKSLIEAHAPTSRTLSPARKESVDFDQTRNLFIEGDNLDVLKLLQETYLNKVKMIYIDPPYNTGSDFVYRDNFAESINEYLIDSGQKDILDYRLISNTEANGRFHSDWLSMMYSRIKLSRNLLKNDGIMFISIDDCEQANLVRICNEIFGEENFLATIVWQKRTGPDSRANLSPAHDYIVAFAKNLPDAKKTLNKLPLRDDRISDYTNKDNDPRGPWASENLTGQTGHATSSQFYKIVTPSGKEYKPPKGRCWALAEKTFLGLQKDKRIWFGKSGNNRPRLKKFLSESDGMMSWTWWPNDEVGHNQEGTKELKQLFGSGDIFNNPKPTRLIKRLILLATQNNDIVLDFFAGSSTTAHATLLLNAETGESRKFIMVQLPELCDKSSEANKLGYNTISEISKERIRRVGKSLKEPVDSTLPSKTEELFDSSKMSDRANLDTGFRVLKVVTSSMSDVYYNPDEVAQSKVDLFTENIKPDRTSEDLLFQVLLDWGVDLSLPISRDTINKLEVFKVDTNALVACFAKKGEITEEFCKILAKEKPLRVVFRDAGFKSDTVKINVEQIFKQLSPSTEVRTI